MGRRTARTVEHKRVVRAWVTDLARRAGATDPDLLARQLTMLIDGGLASGVLDADPAASVAAKAALGGSHGSVYRHFPSKTALRDAVAERWLARVSAPLAVVAAEDGPAPERLRRWLLQLSTEKRRMAREDPELFDTFHTIATQAREVVAEHLRLLAAQITQVIESGIAREEFAPTDAGVAGRAVLQATARFHHPVHAMEWSEPGIDADFDAVIALILRGLRADRPGR